MSSIGHPPPVLYAYDAARALGLPQAELVALARGRIHDTYITHPLLPRYILQRLNTHVFRDPQGLMHNIERVTSHLARAIAAEGATDRERRCLALMGSHAGLPYWIDPRGRWWRAYRYVANSRSRDSLESTAQAHRVAAAYGAFVRQLQDLPGRLHEILPCFHNTQAHLGVLRAAVRDDAHGRAAGARAEIDSIFEREATAYRLTPLDATSELPERVVHNDTKVGNVLFDRDTDEVLCVVDLDTVMPGCLLHDFGDLVRSAAARGDGEEASNPEEVEIDLGLYEALVHGYLVGLRGLLKAAERELLAFAPQLITLELAARFLSDHLMGDRYFKTQFAGQNLGRCRAQLQLLRSMERNASDMRAITEQTVRARPRRFFHKL